jgi:16S rRNA processing protein RimM
VKANRDDPSKMNNIDTGSPHPGEPVFLAVGKLQRAHGLHGEIVMSVKTDFPERLVPGKTLYSGEQHELLVIRSVRPRNKGLIIAFEGIFTPEAARELSNRMVFVRSDELPPLPEGEFYHHQLLGLEIVDQDGVRLGTLVEILETGANDVYIVEEEDGSELLLPGTDDVIISIDLKAKQIQVRPPEYL